MNTDGVTPDGSLVVCLALLGGVLDGIVKQGGRTQKGTKNNKVTVVLD
jgi:hypothetical protein